MNFIQIIKINTTYPNKHLLSLLFVTGIFSLLFASFMTYESSYSQEDPSNSTLLPSQLANIPQFLNESYSIPSAGFHISLPGGWKGLEYQSIAMISPAGVHLMNGNLGPNRDQVLMVIQVLNVPDFQKQRNEYTESEKSGCATLSDRFVKINSINGHELFWQCGLNQDDKVINYFFASENKILAVGLKGAGPVFDNNLEKFRNSVKTLSINKPADISKIR
jgi:hypothetical protein